MKYYSLYCNEWRANHRNIKTFMYCLPLITYDDDDYRGAVTARSGVPYGKGGGLIEKSITNGLYLWKFRSVAIGSPHWTPFHDFRRAQYSKGVFRSYAVLTPIPKTPVSINPTRTNEHINWDCGLGSAGVHSWISVHLSLFTLMKMVRRTFHS